MQWGPFLRPSSVEIRFLSVANLLIHLQIVLLFQHKTTRIYWQLIVLSMLQVVVAAALNLFFLFGAILILYLFVTLTAMLLFFIHRETRPYLKASAHATGTPASSAAIHVIGLPDQEGTAIAGFASSNPQLSLRRGMRRHTRNIAITTVIVTSLVFLLMPRYTNAVWNSPNRQTVTGYSPGVELDEMTEILESPELVMRVSFHRTDSGASYKVTTEPYFRGTVLTEYRRESRRWGRSASYRPASGRRIESSRRRRRPRRPEVGLPEPAPAQRKYITRIEFSMEQRRERTLFSAAPAYHLGPRNFAILRDVSTHELRYQPTEVRRTEADSFRFIVGSSAFHDGVQSAFIPAYVEPEWSMVEQGWSELPEIATSAAQALVDAGAENGNALQRARALEEFFLSRGDFQYSLEPENRNRQIDPIVDFISNHRTGHCEYFASALTLMLRSQSIPARMVLGYKGGTLNVVGNYYQIRELDAHAWVEAFIPEEDIPATEVLPLEDFSQGAWVRLDPTTSAGSLSEFVRVSPWRARINDAMDYVQMLWSEYILGLNQQRQEESIYVPLTQYATAFYNYWFRLERWQLRWQTLRDRIRFDGSQILQGNWLHRQTVLDAGILAILLCCLYLLGRIVLRLGRYVLRRLRWRGHVARQARVPFFEQLEQILAKHGLHRRGEQTPQEFVRLTLDDVDQPQQGILQDLLPRITSAYYRVRFGNQPLDDAEAERIEEALVSIQQTLSSPPS